MLSHPISLRLILKLASHLRPGLQSGFFPPRFPTETPNELLLPHMFHPNNVWRGADLVWVSIIGTGKTFFLSSLKRTYRMWGRPSLIFSKKPEFSAGGKVVRREGNHSPTPSAEIKNNWSNTSAPPICLHSVNRESFTPSD
jgi:hypothetical protein